MKRWLTTLEQGASAILLLVMLVVVLAEIVARDVFRVSFLWSEEMARYLMVWSIYLGAAAAVGTATHLRMELVADRFPPRVGAFVERVGSLACAVFCAIMTFAGYSLTHDTYELGMMSADSRLPIPIWIFYSIIPFCFALMTLHFASRAARGGFRPSSDEKVDL